MNNVLILKFPYSSLYGGGEKHTITLVERLQYPNRRFFLVSTCSVLLAEFSKRHWYHRSVWMAKEPVTLYTLLSFTILLPFTVLQLLLLLTYYRFRHQARIVYCLSLTEKVVGTPIAKLLGMRVIWMEHLLMERWIQWNPYRVFYKWWSRWVTIITVSQAVKRTIVDLGVSPQSVTVIPTGTDLSVFAPRAFSPHPPTIGYLGRLSPEKGLNVLLTAFQKLSSTHPESRLAIVGDGPLQEELKDRVKQDQLQNHVTFYPYQEDIRPLLQHMDVIVMPATRRDSFGMVIIEAGAMGIPAIATSIGGFPEVIEDCVTGWIIPPKNASALAEKLKWVLDHPQERAAAGQAAHRRVSEKYTLEHMIQQFDSLFHHA